MMDNDAIIDKLDNFLGKLEKEKRIELYTIGQYKGKIGVVVVVNDKTITLSQSVRNNLLDQLTDHKVPDESAFMGGVSLAIDIESNTDLTAGEEFGLQVYDAIDDYIDFMNKDESKWDFINNTKPKI